MLFKKRLTFIFVFPPRVYQSLTADCDKHVPQLASLSQTMQPQVSSAEE